MNYNFPKVKQFTKKKSISIHVTNEKIKPTSFEKRVKEGGFYIKSSM